MDSPQKETCFELWVINIKTMKIANFKRISFVISRIIVEYVDLSRYRISHSMLCVSKEDVSVRFKLHTQND